MHRIRAALLAERVRIVVVGCGATGSAFLAGLPYLHQSLIAAGHPGGIDVTVIDGDTVQPANCVRQPFSESDVGLNKATVLVNRLNMFWGLDWKAWPHFLQPSDGLGWTPPHIVVGCVDTRAARSTIQSVIRSSTVLYWLDLGNNTSDGQYVIGEPLSEANNDTRRRLPCVADLYPELLDASLDDDALPSCSAAEALRRQAPFINQVLANHALSLLALLFRTGELAHHGEFIDPRRGQARPIPVPAIEPISRKDVAEIRKLWKSKQWRFGDVAEAYDLHDDELVALTARHWSYADN